jgi:cellulose synthase/poly-beta-1,6-N-acetylglucosamine synthase-like glycosyltransferase
MRQIATPVLADTEQLEVMLLPLAEVIALVHIGEAIASVLAQTYPYLELLAVDDGSHEATPKMVQPFGTALTYIRQAHTSVSAARNRGVAASRGALVALLDSDDVWLPSKVTARWHSCSRRTPTHATVTKSGYATVCG